MSRSYRIVCSRAVRTSTILWPGHTSFPEIDHNWQTTRTPPHEAPVLSPLGDRIWISRKFNRTGTVPSWERISHNHWIQQTGATENAFWVNLSFWMNLSTPFLSAKQQKSCKKSKTAKNWFFQHFPTFLDCWTVWFHFFKKKSYPRSNTCHKNPIFL